MAQIKYGSTKGRYFTQWRFEILKELVNTIIIHKGSPEDINIWYDSENDYHMMSCKLSGQDILVRFYKVFGCTINGERNSRTWVRSDADSIARYLIKESEALVTG